MAITLDTLKFLDDLEKAQVPREQARAIVKVVRESYDSADVATKEDLRALRSDLNGLRAELKSDVAIARRDTVIWLGGMLVIGFGTVITVLFQLLSK